MDHAGGQLPMVLFNGTAQLDSQAGARLNPFAEEEPNAPEAKIHDQGAVRFVVDERPRRAGALLGAGEPDPGTAVYGDGIFAELPWHFGHGSLWPTVEKGSVCSTVGSFCHPVKISSLAAITDLEIPEPARGIMARVISLFPAGAAAMNGAVGPKGGISIFIYR
jgi:hypothetical protein